MRKFLITVTVAGAMALSISGVALANDPHTNGSTGQPSQSCQAQTEIPGGGNRSQSPGSPFTGGNADSHYAGSQPQNSKNPKSVSQYDVACFQASQHG
jgi:hypothetical protein